eukprot:jgi/Botrbrau1/6750/Bobra.0324s0035.1
MLHQILGALKETNRWILFFAHTPTYPDEPPLYKPRSVRGFSQVELDRLKGILEEQVVANIGMAMMYALISAAQDWLRQQTGEGAGHQTEEDPEEAKKRAEEEEERRLAELRSHGVPVTPATFAEWKARFDAEMAAARLRLGEDPDRRDKGPTGKQYFMSLDSRAEQEEEYDYEFEEEEEEEEASQQADGTAQGPDEDEEEDEDFELDEDDDEEEFLDDYLASKGLK